MNARDLAWAALTVVLGLIVFTVATNMSVVQQTGLATSQDYSSAYATAQGVTAGAFVIGMGIWALVTTNADRREQEIQRQRATHK